MISILNSILLDDSRDGNSITISDFDDDDQERKIKMNLNYEGVEIEVLGNDILDAFKNLETEIFYRSNRLNELTSLLEEK